MERKTTALRYSIFLAFVMLGLTLKAQVVYVDPAATGTGGGASWANAMTDLQAAIDAAATVATSASPIQVWVKSGTYKATTGIDRSIGFELKSYVELYGGFDGTETSLAQRNIGANSTILSGDIGSINNLADNSHSPFSYAASFDGVILFDGLTFQDYQDPLNQKGIGLITGANGATVTEVRYQFCEFSNNEIGLGSIYGFSSVPTTFSSCKFVDNGGLNGIVLWVSGGNLKVQNSLFVGNNSAIYHQSGTLELVNNTFYSNNRDVVTVFDQPTPPTTLLYNNIFWGNTMGVDVIVAGSASTGMTAENNLVEDPFTLGTNTISGDPQFLDAANDDFRISNCSPAVDQGTNTPASSITEDLFGSPRVFNTTIDIGAYENQLTPVGISAIELGPVSCAGGADGTINVNGSGGSGSPFEYSIDGVNFQSSGMFQNLAEGNYEVSVRDTGGSCDYKEIVEIVGPTPVEFSISVTASATMNSINVTASGGNAPYTYSLDGMNFQSGALPVTSTGSYTVYVRDLIGCTVSQTYYITSSGSIVLFLDPTATGDGSGNSWANAFTDLQAAIDSAALSGNVGSPTQVWTKSGTYYPGLQSTALRSETISLRNNVSLVGGFAGTETEVSQRDISNNETILSGDIGVANDSTDNSYGMLTIGTDVTDFTKIDGWTLKGAFSLGFESTNGAIHLDGDVGEVEIDNCTFLNNLANEGACIQMARVTNTASVVSITSSYFFNNGFFATSNYIGSAINVKNVTNVYNSLFVKNNSGLGGVFYLNNAGADLTAVNNTFYENGAGTAGAVVYDGTFGTSTLSWYNNINSGEVGAVTAILLLTNAGSTFVGTNNISTQALSGLNNVVADPQFIDPTSYDLRVRYCSPAVDAGDDTQLPATISTDLDGQSRQFNLLDIGAFENQTTPIQLSLVSKEDVSCNGAADGQIEVSATGGTGSVLEFSIDGTTFSTSSNFTGLAPGNYDVTVSDPANGCSISETYNIIEPAALDLTAAATDITCNGAGDGRITGTVTGGTAPFQISLSGTVMATGVTSTFDIGNLPAATYSVLVTDDNACTFTLASSLTIAEPSALSATSSVTNVSCNGDADGTVEVTATGGTAPYEYSTNGTDFQSGNTIAGLIAGSYTITVRDANDCTFSFSETVTEPSALTAVAISATQVSCNGESDASFSFEGSGGTAPYMYSLDGVNFQSSPLWENQSAGSYTITIQDDNGCETTANWTVTEPDALSGSSTATGTSSCGLSDGSIVVSIQGGTSPYMYSLDGGATSQSSNTFSGLTAGSYTVTAIDDNGCELEMMESIDDPVTAVVTTSKVDISCNGEDDGSITVSVSGGTDPITYALNGGTPQSSNVFDNLTAGTYNIVVSEDNGCTQSVSVTLSEPTAIVPSTTVTNLSCNGDSSGEISVSATGGTGPYLYSLGGGAFDTEDTFTGLVAGSYTIAVRDATGCAVIINETISEPTSLSLTVDQIDDALCFGIPNGTFSVVAAGGTAPYQFSIDGTTFGTSSNFTGLVANSYTVTVRDANGCKADVSGDVNNTTSITTTFQITEPLCNGDDNGAITFSPSGGQAPYEFQRLDVASSSQESPTYTGLSAGNYDFRVFDLRGCQVDVSVTISEPDALTSQVSATDISCNGESDGQISASGSGGTSPYEYSIDGTNFQSSPNFTNLSAGTYTVTTTDANACSVTESVSIAEPDAIAVQLTTTNVSCNGESDGTIAASVTGGTGSFEYSIDDTNFQLVPDFTGLAAANYTLTVRDASGCESLEMVTITEPDVLEINVIQSDRSFSATASGGTAPYEFSSDGTNYQSSGTFTDLDPGSYTFRVRDANNCISSSTNFEIALSVDKENEISIHPNPIADYFTVESVEVRSVEVYDLNGKMQEVEMIDRKVDMSELSRGMYLVKLIGDDGKTISINRVIKNN